MPSPWFSSVAKTLADYTAPELLIPASINQSPNPVLAELCSTLRRQGRLNDSTAFSEAVLVRERMSPTSYAPGWALPHARLAELPELCFAVARATHPMKWFGDSGALVQAIFLFAVPEHETRAYLTLIAALARFSQNVVLVEKFHSAADSMQMFAVLQQVPLPRPVERASRSTPSLH